MREKEPDFDYELFEKEVEHIFEECYNAYLRHDIDVIATSCISEGLSYFRG